MTREEAIAELKRDIELENDFTEDYINAVNIAIEALEQEPILDKIRSDIEKLANDEWNTKVGSVSQGLECALEIIEAYQEGR